jgi:hypothetical protein
LEGDHPKQVVEKERDLFIVVKNLPIYVLSNYDWMWSLAFVCLGVPQVWCVALTQEADRQLGLLIEHPYLRQKLCPWNLESGFNDEPQVIACHLTDTGVGHSRLMMTQMCRNLACESTTLVLTSIGSGRAWNRMIKDELGPKWIWQTIRHSAIGGLTAARKELGYAMQFHRGHQYRIDVSTYPKWSYWGFLEPGVRLQMVSKISPPICCWRPVTEEGPCPWPWGELRLWVEAPTCFKGRGVKNGLVERPVTDKERIQQIDLGEDWGLPILDHVWSWNNGAPTPLRLLAEYIRGIDRAMFEIDSNSGESKGNSKEKRNTKDISGKPGISVAELRELSDGGALKRMEYFGLVWDAGVGEVMGAAKPDGAAVDCGLWAIGGIPMFFLGYPSVRIHAHRFGERKGVEIIKMKSYIKSLIVPTCDSHDESTSDDVAYIDNADAFNQYPPGPKSHDDKWNDIEMLFVIQMLCLMTLQYGGLHEHR